MFRRSAPADSSDHDAEDTVVFRRNSLPSVEAALDASNWMMNLPMKARGGPTTSRSMTLNMNATSTELLEDDEVSLDDFETEATAVQSGLENSPSFVNNLSFHTSLPDQNDVVASEGNRLSDSVVTTAIKNAIVGMTALLQRLLERGLTELQPLRDDVDRLQQLLGVRLYPTCNSLQLHCF